MNEAQRHTCGAVLRWTTPLVEWGPCLCTETICRNRDRRETVVGEREHEVRCGKPDGHSGDHKGHPVPHLGQTYFWTDDEPTKEAVG